MGGGIPHHSVISFSIPIPSPYHLRKMSSLSYGVSSQLYGGGPQDYTVNSWYWGCLSIPILHSHSQSQFQSKSENEQFQLWGEQSGMLVEQSGMLVEQSGMLVAPRIILSSPGTGGIPIPRPRPSRLTIH